MTRIVVDAKVYISALVFGGVPQKVLELLESKDLSLYVSEPIMDEVSEVLSRKFNWTRRELDDFLPRLWERCTLIAPQVSVTVCQDPDDNRILECAQASGATFIVTGDHHLLREALCRHQNRDPAGFCVQAGECSRAPPDATTSRGSPKAAVIIE